jgi:HK97 family phage prohead protease
MTIHRALGYVDRASLADGSPLRVVMATEGRKADNIDLRMSGARLDRFRANPVLGYGHAYWGRENLPIGRVDPDTIDVVGTALAGSLSFDADDDFAVKVERKMRAGYVNAVSIGFDVLEWENGKGDVWRGGVATAWEMTELSVVPVPMDANAVVTSGRSLFADADRALLRALAAEFAAERVLAALTGLTSAPEQPAPPVQDPTPAAPAGVDPDAARALLAAFAKES